MNLVNILDTYQKGQSLYLITHGYCTFEDILNNHIYLRLPDNSLVSVDSEGKLNSEGECVLFPTKKCKNWKTLTNS